MTRQPSTGIPGILDNLLASPAEGCQATGDSTANTNDLAVVQSLVLQAQTRRGRPAGSRHPNQPPKEKTTLRIEAQLIADYRDWSWDARCHLSGLVERAMADYQRRNRR